MTGRSKFYGKESLHLSKERSIPFHPTPLTPPTPEKSERISQRALKVPSLAERTLSPRQRTLPLKGEDGGSQKGAGRGGEAGERPGDLEGPPILHHSPVFLPHQLAAPYQFAQQAAGAASPDLQFPHQVRGD